MRRNDRWPKYYDPGSPKSRPGSRRSSAKKEAEGEDKSPGSTPSSSHSTPKEVVKPLLDFVVTGKQILTRYDRANSLPSHQRRASVDGKTKRSAEPKPVPTPQSSKSRETSLEDDISLDLSQVSDFDETNSKFSVPKNLNALATSTPKEPPRNFQKPRSASVQGPTHAQKVEASRRRDVASRGSLKSSCASRYGASTDLDYTSVTPESSTEMSPRGSLLTRGTDLVISPRSQDLMMSSCCLSSWQDCSQTAQVEEYRRGGGEWSDFWAHYNAAPPVKGYYDQCPTPYRTEDIDLADLEFSTAGSRVRAPEDVKNINSIIRNEGLHLTPRETQNIIKCAHILGNVLTKAIERRSKEKDEKVQEIPDDLPAPEEKTPQDPEPEIEIKKKTLTLDLKETNVPLEVQKEKRCETVTTQTDISLPNTKSAPKIFEKILRQLSRTSLEEGTEKKLVENKEDDATSQVVQGLEKIDSVENVN